MAEEDKKAWDEYEQDRDAALRREQQQSRRQQELLRQQQQYQQQYAQQYQQQQYQQQYAQQLYQQYQQQFMVCNSNSISLFDNVLQNEMFLNIMKSLKSQADLRQQQQQQLYIQAQQQQQEQQQPQQAVANGLPGYDVMSLEDIVKYVKGLYSSIDSQSLIERMYSIISSGLESCQKEMQSIEMQVSYYFNLI